MSAVPGQTVTRKTYIRIVGQTWKLLMSVRLMFHYMDEEMVKKLIVAVIQPRLKYAAVISPHAKAAHTQE